MRDTEAKKWQVPMNGENLSGNCSRGTGRRSKDSQNADYPFCLRSDAIQIGNGRTVGCKMICVSKQERRGDGWARWQQAHPGWRNACFCREDPASRESEIFPAEIDVDVDIALDEVSDPII